MRTRFHVNRVERFSWAARKPGAGFRVARGIRSVGNPVTQPRVTAASSARHERCVILCARNAEGATAAEASALREFFNAADADGWWFVPAGTFIAAFLTTKSGVERASACESALCRLKQTQQEFRSFSVGVAEGAVLCSFSSAGNLHSMPMGTVINDAMSAAIRNAATTAQAMANPVAVYIRAKDENLPELMRRAFAEDATLEMVVNSGAISFPPFTEGVGSITDVLVTRFNQTFENVRTFCLANPPKPDSTAFSCAWLVGMSEKETGAVRVGCGRYDWSFHAQGLRLANRLRITIEEMEMLPPQDLAAVMNWLSKLPYPWCNSQLALHGAPHVERLEPIVRFLRKMESEDA
jgi:hypothetical protein